MDTNRTLWNVPAGLAVCAVAAALIVGCTGRQPAAEIQAEQAGHNEPGALGVLPAQPTEDLTAGAQLWAENCVRCHNYRSPSSLSDRQWKIVMHHMRVRANLTAEEHEQILQFLQAAN